MSKKKQPNIVHKFLAPNIFYAIQRGLLATCRYSSNNDIVYKDFIENDKNMIFSAWHGRLLLFPYYYRYVHGRKNLCIMASKSRDGEMIKRILGKFDIETVRGSTSRGGISAMKALIKATKSGKDTALTVDGSKGPVFKVQPGILLLAQITGIPIIPLAYDASKKIVLNTWDKLIIPLPFSRIHVSFGDLIHVPRDAKDLEPYRQKLQKTMDEITECCRKEVED